MSYTQTDPYHPFDDEDLWEAKKQEEENWDDTTNND